MFVDSAKLKVLGGSGGDGCVSFRREKYVPRGGPNGGDGGDGGAVILRADSGQQSLVDQHYMPHAEGARGGHGAGKDCHGARGADTIVPVPIGTVVFDAETGEQLADLTEEDQEFTAAIGGKGGKGNCNFATSTRRAPRISTPGGAGQERVLQLELRTIADVGLVGCPNAGKSSLLGCVSDAHPKAAPYLFTTRYPVVGVVEFPDFCRVTIADIPGLLEGAHRNVGLGHEFLRHIERSRVLAYVLDMSGVEGRKPWEDLEMLLRELELHQTGLSSRPAVLVANKMDIGEAEVNLTELRGKTALPVVPVSALTGWNKEAFLAALRELLESLH